MKNINQESDVLREENASFDNMDITIHHSSLEKWTFNGMITAKNVLEYINA